MNIRDVLVHIIFNNRVKTKNYTKFKINIFLNPIYLNYLGIKIKLVALKIVILSWKSSSVVNID